MIRTCRLFFPVRNSYNVSLFNQRPCQPKQISVEFSFCPEQRKENYLQKKSYEKVEFSTFKEIEKYEQDRTQQKKSKENTLPDYVTFKANKEAKKASSASNEPVENVNIDFSTFKENLKSKSAATELEVKPLNVTQHKNNENIDIFGVTANENINQINNFSKSARTFGSKMDPSEAIQSLKIMTKTGTRALSEMNSITEVLLAKKGSYSLKESCDVLYSFAKLSFANMPVLNLLAKNVSEALSKDMQCKPKVLVSLLQSVCKLKYRNCELIQNLCEKLNDIKHLLSTEQTTLCLFALSTVNVQSIHTEHFIQALSKLKITDFSKTRNFLNYVWASIILEKENSLPLKHLEMVLSQSFVEQLTICGDNTLLNKIKLSNISGVASDMKNYKGPLLDNLILSPVLSNSKNNFLNSVKDSMSYIFPKAGFFEALSYAGSGVFIDIECCLDSSSNPVLLKNKEDHNKIGLILLDHSDICLDNTTMTGVTAFKIARIKSRGYKVVTIPHSQFPFNGALSAKIGYLKNKFKKTLAQNSSK